MGGVKGIEFPLFKTKLGDGAPHFRLEDPVERRRYFELKAGSEIEKLRDYLRTGTFAGFLLGKKNSGKGTYAKLFMEAIGGDRIAHISVGDIVRLAQRALSDPQQRNELRQYLGRTYRGFVELDTALDQVLKWDVRIPLPTEIILALVQREIDRLERKALFIDGFPRNLDQVSYSVYFRALIGYRDDPDFFVFIDVPETVIDERMRGRVICPTCQTPRGLKLLRTKEVGYDPERREFYLVCDNPGCPNPSRMVAKEGDELGIEAIRERVELDDQVMRQLLELEGVPKIFLRNAIPATRADELADEYEITPAYRYAWDEAKQAVRVIEEPWIVPDDAGVPSYSLLPAAVAVALIKQTAGALGL